MSVFMSRQNITSYYCPLPPGNTRQKSIIQTKNSVYALQRAGLKRCEIVQQVVIVILPSGYFSIEFVVVEKCGLEGCILSQHDIKDTYLTGS